MLKVRTLFFFILTGLSLFGNISYAQKIAKPREKFAPDSATFSLAVDQKQDFSQGKIFAAKIHFKRSSDHWHIYSSKSDAEASFPLKVAIPNELGNNFQLVGFEERGKSKRNYDSNFSAWTQAFYSDFDIIAKVKVRSAAKLGSDPFYLLINYQTCNESNCIPPNTFTVPMLFLGKQPLQLAITKGTGAVDLPDSTPVVTRKDTSSKISAVAPSGTNGTIQKTDAKKIEETSLWGLIAAAIGAGLLGLTTPCVFPMVPITVSFFTKRNQGSKKHALKDATFYAVGIISTFVVLGVLLNILFGAAAINEFAANPIVNIFITLIFIAFALNLFGLYELGVPNEILNKIHIRATTHENQIVSVIKSYVI